MTSVSRHYRHRHNRRSPMNGDPGRFKQTFKNPPTSPRRSSSSGFFWGHPDALKHGLRRVPIEPASNQTDIPGPNFCRTTWDFRKPHVMRQLEKTCLQKMRQKSWDKNHEIKHLTIPCWTEPQPVHPSPRNEIGHDLQHWIIWMPFARQSSSPRSLFVVEEHVKNVDFLMSC